MTDTIEPEADEVNEEQLEDVSGGALTVDKPKDKYEREADQVAEQVISDPRTPDTSTQ